MIQKIPDVFFKAQINYHAGGGLFSSLTSVTF